MIQGPETVAPSAPGTGAGRAATEGNPYAPPTETFSSDWRILYGRVALCAFYAFVATAVLAGREHRGSEALSELGAAAALLLWCSLDAPLRGKEFHHGLALPFIVTWPVAAAFYLFWTRGWRGLRSYPVLRLLTSLDVLDEGYGDAIAAAGEDTAANVRAHRRVFQRLGFFAEGDDGALWAFDLAANVEEPPVIGLDKGGQYAWLGIDLEQALAQDENAAWVATQFLPSLRDLQARYYCEEKGVPRPTDGVAVEAVLKKDSRQTPRSISSADP